MSDNAIEMKTMPTERVDDLKTLDSHLAHLYRAAAGTNETSAAVPVVTTTLLNLIVYASTQEQADNAVSVVSEVMGSHPCRAILLEALVPEERESTASVSAVCGITERGDRRLCGDIVRIHTVGLEQQLEGNVVPLLVPDVPVFLWLTDIPETLSGISNIPPGILPGGFTFDKPEMKWISELTDHFIIDSRRFADLRSGLEMVLSSISRDARNKDVQDLCWISLAMWRELTAQHFDSKIARSYLNKLNRVNLQYQPEKENQIPAAPLQFVSWLIERLNLTLKTAQSTSNGYIINAEKDRRSEISLQISYLEGAPTSSQRGQILSVTIEAGDENGKATFVTKAESAGKLSVLDECEGICYTPQIFEMSEASESTLISRALDSYGSDDLYKNAIHVALDILEKLE